MLKRIGKGEKSRNHEIGQLGIELMGFQGSATKSRVNGCLRYRLKTGKSGTHVIGRGGPAGKWGWACYCKI